MKEKNYVKQLNDEFIDLAPMTLMFEDTCPKKSWKDTSKKIRKFYFGDKTIDESTKFPVIDVSFILFFQIIMFCGIIFWAFVWI